MSLAVYNPRWPEQYEAERKRLLAALGALTEGGIVEGIQHIGATTPRASAAISLFWFVISSVGNPKVTFAIKYVATAFTLQHTVGGGRDQVDAVMRATAKVNWLQGQAGIGHSRILRFQNSSAR